MSNDTESPKACSISCYIPGISVSFQYRYLLISNYITLPSNCICLLISTLLNFLILVSIYKKRQLRTASTVLLCSLNVKDLCLVSILQPFEIYRSVYLLTNDNFCAKYTGSKVRVMFLNMYRIVALFTMVLISIDRWLAIRKPNLYRRAFTMRRVILFTAMIWAYTLISTGILYNIPSITRIPRGRFMVAQLGLAMVFIMISQIHVYISIKKQFKTGVHPSNGQQQREALIERNVAIVVIYVVIGVAVSHVPNFILKLSTNSYYSSVTSCWLNLLLLANAVANPIIWLKTNGKLRRTVLKIFKAWSHCREPDLSANSSEDTEMRAQRVCTNRTVGPTLPDAVGG